MTCETCTHCIQLKERDELRYACRRFPPVPMTGVQTNPLTGKPQPVRVDAFPYVLPSWTCGEHLPGVLQ